MQEMNIGSAFYSVLRLTGRKILFGLATVSMISCNEPDGDEVSVIPFEVDGITLSKVAKNSYTQSGTINSEGGKVTFKALPDSMFRKSVTNLTKCYYWPTAEVFGKRKSSDSNKHRITEVSLTYDKCRSFWQTHPVVETSWGSVACDDCQWCTCVLMLEPNESGETRFIELEFGNYPWIHSYIIKQPAR